MTTKGEGKRTTELPGPRRPGQILETDVDALDQWDDSMGDPQRDIRRIEILKLPPEVRAALEKIPGTKYKTIGFKSCFECGQPVLLNAGVARWARDEDGRVERVRHHNCGKPHEFPKEGISIPMKN